MSLKTMPCTLGKFDIPIIQKQPPLIVDILDANIIVFGSSMSGKTSFIKNLINVLHKKYDEKNERIFILDFGGALTDYRNMPLVSAYYDNSNEEYVKRIFRIMDNILKENIKELNGRNFREAENNQPVHTTFFIDNFNAFAEEQRYSLYHEKFAKLCRDGLSKGISIVVTAGETKGLSQYLANFRQKIAFEMPADKYPEIFISKVGIIGNNPGHGFANVTIKPEGVTGTFRMNLPYEVQCCFPEAATDENSKFLAALRKKFRYNEESRSYEKCVKKYLTFPKELTRSIYREYIDDNAVNTAASVLCAGLDYVDFKPVAVDYEKSHVVAIYGKKEFGKTNLLNLMTDDLAAKIPGVRFVFLDDGREQLAPVYKRFRDNVDCVMFDKFDKVQLIRKDGTEIQKKLSPLEQFFVYLNENYIEFDKRMLASYFDLSDQLKKDYENVPDCMNEVTPFTVFIIQSKLIYLNTLEGKRFMSSVLPQMAAVAEERKYLFIFSDVQKLNEAELNSIFNNQISVGFLLDNIAKFAGERGQRTIFGNMDVKYLKEEYAKCELGDGYCYDTEADKLQKLKFIKWDN